MKVLKSLAKQLKDLRTERGMTQADLAGKADCGRNAISNLENGTPVGTDKLEKVVSVLNGTVIIVDNEILNDNKAIEE